MAELEIRLSGSGGQGILLIGRILGEALTQKRFKVAQSQSYEPTSRGGLSRSDLVASDHDVDYPLATSLDYLVVLHKIAIGASDQLLKSSSLIIIDSPLSELYRPNNGQCVFLPISETAKRLGSIRSTNMVALGTLLALSDICDEVTLFAAIEQVAPAKLVESSLEAVKEGYRIAQNSQTADQADLDLVETSLAERVPLVSL